MAVTSPRKPACCTDALHRSHEDLRTRLTGLAEHLLDELPSGSGIPAARTALLDFLRSEIIPKAAAEEAVAGSADPTLRALLQVLPGRRRMLEVLADEIATQRDGVSVAAAIGGLVLLCDARWDSEDQVLLPALGAAGVDLEQLMI